MGFPFFSWRPHQDYTLAGGMGGRETILLSEDLTDLQITPRRDVVDVYSIGGGRSRQNLRAWMDVRITLDRFTDRELFRQFTDMINHLERGGTIAFGNDHQKAVLARLNNNLPQGKNVIGFGYNLCSEYSTGVSDTTLLSTGDEIVIESSLPKANRHYTTVGTPSGYTSPNPDVGRYTIGLNLSSEFTDKAWVRHSDFFPTLILPTVGQQFLTHDRRLTYTLDIQLAYILPYLEGGDTIQPTFEKTVDPNFGADQFDR